MHMITPGIAAAITPRSFPAHPEKQTPRRTKPSRRVVRLALHRAHRPA